MKYLYLLSTFFLMISCSSQYHPSSNLDPDNFEQYFSVGKVSIYDTVKLLPEDRQLVGIVTGEDCQAKPHLAAPDPVRARTDARRKAYKLNANAIVFSQCITITPENNGPHSCYKEVLCHGQAYQVITP